MAHDHGTAAERLMPSSRARRVVTSLVGWSSSSRLPPPQELGQMHAVAFAARQFPTFLLVGVAEIEAGPGARRFAAQVQAPGRP